MAAPALATSSCDDGPGSHWPASKAARPRTGWGDEDGAGAGAGAEGVGLGDRLATDGKWRCGSVGRGMQRDPTWPLSAPIFSSAGEVRLTLEALHPSPAYRHDPGKAHARGECAVHRPEARGRKIADLFRQWSRPTKASWDTELLEAAEHRPLGAIEPPPSYDESARDCPPPYTVRKHSVHLPPPPEPRPSRIDPSKPTAVAAVPPMTPPKPDWGSTSNFRQVGKNKKKKKADENNWGSGDEGKKEGGADDANTGGDAGGEGVGGGGAGAGAGAGAGDGGDDGDGGAGDGGGGGDWNTGKKKKKGKKEKAVPDEEEEEKKKEEEEKEEERKIKEQQEEEERKRKEEEEAATAGNPSSWPDGGDADPGAEWGFTKADKKGKKGRKGKIEEEEKKRKEEEERKRKEEEEEEEKKRKVDEEAVAAAEAVNAADPLSWADTGRADTTADWGAFTTAGKKGKKGKKQQEDVHVEENKKPDEEEAAHTADPLSWADPGQADADTAWGGFTMSDKKGKKAKKGKVRGMGLCPRATF